MNFYVCGPFSSPELCTSTSSPVGTGSSLNSSSPGSDDFATATSESFTPPGAGTYCFAAVYTPVGGSYQASADNNSGTVDSNECVNVAGAANTSWPNAQTLTPPTPPAGTTGTIAESGESLWYDFAVQPDEQVQVSLSNVPADYNVLVFSDIGAAFQAATSSTPNLAALGAQSPASDSSYNQVSPLGVSPLGVSPLGVSPLGISPLGVSPLGVSPLGVSPLGVSSGALNPANFNPALTPAELTDAYSDAEVDSLLAVSSASGAVDKSVTVDTWNNTGNFYVAITGNNGASAPSPFTLGVTITGGPCAGVTLDTYSGDSTLSGPGTGTFNTVIVDNSNLMPAVAQGSLNTALQTLATETIGTVVDVGQSQMVNDLVAQAKANPGCPYAKNLVADAIQDIINSYRGPSGGANLKNVVIVGDDNVIPFFRYPDNAGLGAESSYEPPLLSTSAADAALQTPDYLSDDQYGAASVLDIQGTTVPLQTAAVGRLVETPSDILLTIDSYLTTTDGGLGHQAIVPSSTLATGYSFMQPPASEVAAAFAQGVSPGTNTTLISAEDDPPSASWTASDLSTALFGAHHDLVFLGGHFSANALEAADETTTITTNQFASSVGSTLEDSLVLSAGCHSGYTIDPLDGVPDVTDTLSWPQAFSEAGATLIAGTGYQYGDTNYVAYSDQVYVELAKQLGYAPTTDGGTVAVGTALLAAKQQYLSTLDHLNGIEEKALLQITLYGLPMLGLDEHKPTTASPNSSVIGTTSPEAPGTPGAQLDLQYADLDLGPLSPAAQTVTPPGSGTTYTYDSGPQGVVADPSSPVLPVYTDNVNASSGTLRGVGFMSGSYSDSSVDNPLTGDPVTDTANPEVTPFTSPVFFPQTMWNPNYFSTLLNGAGTTNLTFTPVQYESATGTSAKLRAYSNLDVHLFYSDNTSSFGGNTPALAAAPTINYVTSTTTGDVVNVSATVTGDPSAGIQDVWVTFTGDQPGNPLYGSWQSVDLTQSSTNSTLWTGSFTDASAADPTGSANPATDSVFIVQAVNGVGEVSMDDNAGYYFTPNFTPGAPLTNANTYSLTFGPNTGGQYMGTATITATLQQTNRANGDVSGQPITFGCGSAATTVMTDGSGIASVTIPLTLPPAGYTFTAYYAGDAGDAPVGTQEAFTVSQASTALCLSPPGQTTCPSPLGQITSGANNGVSATLTSGGAPLSQKTVYFDIFSGITVLLSLPAITNNSGVAQSGPITLPQGDVGPGYEVTAYFGSSAVPLVVGSPYNASDPDYSESIVSGSLAIADATQTSLVATPAAPVYYGQSVTLTATVSVANSNGSASPGNTQGTVAFSQGGLPIALCQAQGLLSGQATCTVNGLTPATYSFSATYSGYSGSTAAYLLSTSANTSLSVGMSPTLTTLTGNGTTVSGQSVTFTATVTPVSPGSGTPTGNVAFLVTPSGGQQVPLYGCTAPQPLGASSSATCTTTFLAAQGSSYSISAQYSGDNNFSGGSPASGLPLTVNKASTSTKVVSTTGSPSVSGQAVTYTATVGVGAPGTGTPTGKVEFFDTGSAITACGNTGAALSGATATCTVTTYSSTGSHTITAQYLGDSNYSASALSGTIAQVVGVDATTVVLTSTSGANSSTSTPGSSVTGQSITYSAAVSANSPGSGTPLGTVTIAYTPSGGKAVTMCSGVALVSGKAACGDGAILVEAGSPYTITATYQPSTSPTSFAGSSATVTEKVTAASTKTQLMAQSTSSFGSSVSLKATVTAVAPGFGTPAGSVTFYDGSAVVGTAALATAGTATLVVTGLQGGSQSFTASYGGSPNFAPSSTSIAATDVVGFTRTISGTYSGSLIIGSGQLVSVTGKVTGSVAVAPGGALEVNGGSIGGALASAGAVAFTLCDAKVGGSLAVIGSSGFVFIGGSVPAGTGCGGSSIAGAMALINNKGGLEMATSTVSGAAAITGNSGYGPVEQSGVFPPPEVAGNTISGPLACSGNTPSLTDASMSNKAALKSGQCDAPTTF